MDKELYVGIIDMTQCTEEQKTDLGWLALAQVIGNKQCPICGRAWKSREDIILTNPKVGYNGDYVCSGCWGKYMSINGGGK